MIGRLDRLNIAVLMGGLSSEREISLSTGRQVMQGLDKNRYKVFGVDAGLWTGTRMKRQQGALESVEAVGLASKLLMQETELLGMDALLGVSSIRPDLVFVALHGRFGEDGCVQGLLEILGLPYTGSGVLASALAMDKSMSKAVMASAGITVPDSFELSRSDLRTVDSDMQSVMVQAGDLGYPLIVKPSRQGSTIGMTRVFQEDTLVDAVREAAKYDDLVLVEKLIEGIELTVSVLGNQQPEALPVIEIVPAAGFYDYKAKYTPGATEEIVPARIDARATETVQELAVNAHRALGCRGASRVDFIYDGHEFYALEVNTIPGMTPTSLLPRAAEAAGISFSSLLDRLVDLALEDVEVSA